MINYCFGFLRAAEANVETYQAAEKRCKRINKNDKGKQLDKISNKIVSKYIMDI